MNLQTATVQIRAGARGGFDVLIGKRIAAEGVSSKPAAQKAAVTALEALGVRSRDAEALARTAVKSAPKPEPLKKGVQAREPKPPVGGKLADDLWRYFAMEPDAEVVPLAKLVGTRVRLQGAATASAHLRAALLGARAKLPPLTVELRKGGRYTVLVGNSVLAVARTNGWEHLPVKVRTP